MNNAMQMLTKIGRVAALLLAATIVAAHGHGQGLKSGASPIALNAVLSDSITLTLSGNAVNFSLVGGSAINPGSTGITATTYWVLRPSVNSLHLYRNNRTTTTTQSKKTKHNIPSADFQISANGGAFAPLTN